MIHFITPWTTDKNLSKFYNDTIEALPANHWACFTDRDTYFPHPFFGTHIERVVERHGEKIRLFTCMTNRVGTPYQCNPRMWDVDNAGKHEDAANIAWLAHSSNVQDISNETPISGMLILVKKEFITDNRKLKDGLLLGADNEFSYIAKENNEMVGLMKGIYIWHYYRNGDQSNKKHLL